MRRARRKLSARLQSVPAPPGVVMFAPQTLLRKAEGTQSKGRVVLSGQVEQRGQQHTHYKGRDTPKDTAARSVHLSPRNRTRKYRSTPSSSNSFALRLSNSCTT